jgi:hypothetical protein
MIVVASAAKFEVSALLQLLDSQEISYCYLEVGIGAIRSSKLAEAMKQLVIGRNVLFVGTCGSSEQARVGQVVTAGVCAWKPISVNLQASYLISGIEEPICLDPLSSDSLPVVEISCSSTITKINLKNSETCRFENIELYSVATCWRELAGKFFTLMGVTNLIGPDSHEQWLSNHRSMAEKTSKYILEPKILSQILGSLVS